MKKLEPGMLCMVVGSLVPKNNGKIVTLIKFCGKPEFRSASKSGGWDGDDWWRIDTKVTVTSGDAINYVRGCRLQPIDHRPADEQFIADFKRIITHKETTQ